MRVVVYAEEDGSALAIGERRHRPQPALGLAALQGGLELSIGDFGYQVFEQRYPLLFRC
jgi:hypothetical protein